MQAILGSCCLSGGLRYSVITKRPFIFFGLFFLTKSRKVQFKSVKKFRFGASDKTTNFVPKLVH